MDNIWGRIRVFAQTANYWIWGSIVGTVATLVVLQVLSGNLPGNPIPANVAALFVWLLAATSLLGYFGRLIQPLSMVLLLVTQATLALLSYATIYYHFGLATTLPDKTVINTEYIDSVYFSVVTWTTLGYGDITPPRSIRLVAMLQAVQGYVFLGLIVGIMSSDMGKLRSANSSAVQPGAPQGAQGQQSGQREPARSAVGVRQTSSSRPSLVQPAPEADDQQTTPTPPRRRRKGRPDQEPGEGEGHAGQSSKNEEKSR